MSPTYSTNIHSIGFIVLVIDLLHIIYYYIGVKQKIWGRRFFHFFDQFCFRRDHQPTGRDGLLKNE